MSLWGTAVAITVVLTAISVATGVRMGQQRQLAQFQLDVARIGGMVWCSSGDASGATRLWWRSRPDGRCNIGDMNDAPKMVCRSNEVPDISGLRCSPLIAATKEKRT